MLFPYQAFLLSWILRNVQKEKGLAITFLKRTIQMNLLIKQKQTHRLREWAYGCRGEEIFREFGIDMYTLLNLKWVTNKDLLCNTGKSAQCYMAAWMGGEFGGNGYIYTYGWVSSLFNWNHYNYVYICVCERRSFICVWLFVIPWTVVCRVPLSMEFSRPEY